MSQPTYLANGSRVGVVGGGPAGSFFAIELLRRARSLGLRLRVEIFDGKSTQLKNFNIIYFRSTIFFHIVSFTSSEQAPAYSDTPDYPPKSSTYSSLGAIPMAP